MDIHHKKARDFFEKLYKLYNNKDYIDTDPIRFAHQLEGNKEFIAFTSSCFAYGNMKAIQSFLFKYFDYAGCDPLKININVNDKLYYRFQNKNDISAYSKLMNEVYNKYGSLSSLFKSAGVSSINNVDKGIILLRSHIKDITNGLNFLIPVPGKSASKRLYMFLRWMVRKDEVDFGFWDFFDKSSLFMPVDTHIMRMAINLNIVDKKDTPKKALEKVTSFFKELNYDDPAKYDFSITRLGIVSNCKYSENEVCSNCINNQICVFN